MKQLTKFLLVSVLAFCCVLGLAACGDEDKTYAAGRFELTNYDLYKDGQNIGAADAYIDNVGNMDKYYIELDYDGNMTFVFIELSYITYGDSAGKYKLTESEATSYTYYINSKNEIVIKDGNATVSYDMSINETIDVIMFYGTMQTGDAQVISKFERAV